MSALREPRPLAVPIKKAVVMIGLGRTSIYNEIKAGRLRPIKRRSRTLFPVTEIERYLREERASD